MENIVASNDQNGACPPVSGIIPASGNVIAFVTGRDHHPRRGVAAGEIRGVPEPEINRVKRSGSQHGL